MSTPIGTRGENTETMNRLLSAYCGSVPVCSFLSEASANAIGSFFGALVLLVLVERRWYLRDAGTQSQAGSRQGSS